MITVGKLKEIIKDLPDYMPLAIGSVYVDAETDEQTEYLFYDAVYKVRVRTIPSSSIGAGIIPCKDEHDLLVID